MAEAPPRALVAAVLFGAVGLASLLALVVGLQRPDEPLRSLEDGAPRALPPPTVEAPRPTVVPDHSGPTQAPPLRPVALPAPAPLAPAAPPPPDLAVAVDLAPAPIPPSTRFADPGYSGATLAEAADAALHAPAAMERQRALDWLGAHGRRSQLPAVLRIAELDGDPTVRKTATAAAEAIRSRMGPRPPPERVDE